MKRIYSQIVTALPNPAQAAGESSARAAPPGQSGEAGLFEEMIARSEAENPSLPGSPKTKGEKTFSPGKREEILSFRKNGERFPEIPQGGLFALSPLLFEIGILNPIAAEGESLSQGSFEIPAVLSGPGALHAAPGPFEKTSLQTGGLPEGALPEEAISQDEAPQGETFELEEAKNAKTPVVSILEGPPRDKEIPPLAQQAFGAAENALKTEKDAAQVKEVQARTPSPENQPEETLDAKPEPDAAKHPGKISCPPENVNEQQTAEKKGERRMSGADLSARPTALETKKQEPLPRENGAPLQPPSFSAQTLVVSERAKLSGAPRAAVPVENLFDEMVERIAQDLSKTPRIEIDLKPDRLGKLSIDLLMGAEGITAKIKTSDEGVRNLLAAQVSSLSETLSQKGIKIESLDVVYSSLADKSFEDRPQTSGEREKRQRSRTADTSLSGVRTDAVPPLFETGSYLADYPASSVEYRA